MFYLHVGLHYGAPFRPTLSLLMEQVADVADAGGGGYVLLQDCQTWMTAVRLADSLKQSDTWLCQVYHLEESPRPIARMLPGTVSALKVSTAAVQIWPKVLALRPGPRRVIRRRPAPGPGGPGDGSDDEPESDSDGGSSAEDEDDEGPDDSPPDLPPPAEEPGDVAADEALSSDPELEDDVAGENEQAIREIAFADLLDETMASFEIGELAAAAPAEPQEAHTGASSSGLCYQQDTHTQHV